MKKFSSVLASTSIAAVMMFSLIPAAAAGTGPSMGSPVLTIPRTVHVSSIGKMTVAADTAVINLNVETRGVTAKEAQTSNRADLEKVTNVLVSNGISKNQIKSGWYSLYPEYDYNITPTVNGTYPIKGYIANNTIYVDVKNLDKITTVLDSIVEIESVRIGNVGYKAENKTAAEDEARAMAVRAAKSKAGKLADMFKITLGQIRSISEYTNDPYYYDGGGQPQQNIEISVQVDLEYEIGE